MVLNPSNNSSLEQLALKCLINQSLFYTVQYDLPIGLFVFVCLQAAKLFRQDTTIYAVGNLIVRRSAMSSALLYIV